MLSVETMLLLSLQLTWTDHVVRMNDDRLPKAVLYGELWQAKQNDTYATWIAQSDTSTRGPGRRWHTMTYGRQKRSRKSRNQPMPKSNDNAAMNVRSRLQIAQISSQCSHVDTTEGNWRLVLANYPMKELVRENVERFCDVNVVFETEKNADIFFA